MKLKVSSVSNPEAIEFAERLVQLKHDRRKASQSRQADGPANTGEMKPPTFKLNRKNV